MENEEKKGVGWIIPGKLYRDLEHIAKVERRSVTSTAVLIMEKGVKSMKNAQMSQSAARSTAESKTIDIISGCNDLKQLNSALAMVQLFVMAFGESERIHQSYEERKTVLT